MASAEHAEGARGVANPFYRRARQLMASLGMNDTELRRRSGVTVNTFKNLEVITRRPQARVINAIADAVGMDRQEAHQLAGLIPAAVTTSDINVRDAILRSTEFSEQQARALLQLVDIFTGANATTPGETDRHGISGEAVGAQMPTQIRLDDLAMMAAADEHHRYELSPEGVLSVGPPADPDHALLVSRMFAWLVTHGYGAEQVVVDCGVEVGGGARIPDLTVWAAGMPPRAGRSSYAGTDGLLLVVEVVSGGSEVIDRVIKKAEYARAGVPRYWIVERDDACTVYQHILNRDIGEYECGPTGHQPIAGLLAAVPDLS